MNIEILTISVGVGAAIGYVTNYVAIKLLFRPYKPVKLKNILIFPQGVIPREKNTLAKKVGAVVKNYILSEEEIKKIVTNKGVKKEIEIFLEGEIEKFLSQDITELTPKDELAKNLGTWIDNLIKSKFPMLGSFIDASTIERLLSEVNLGIKLNKFVNKEKVKNKLLNEIYVFMECELPKILIKANIEKIVEDKINSFDEKKLEDMLFVLMKKHFGFINVAGAVLGGIIGFVQYFVIQM
ncbi:MULTISPECIES: DUF445 domain-containing protein [unclassified Lebetimonas]|uniref:DUF445 domain-containing protein n=1 Tax=unclassified Lebetimonas TaxID=2648158 RepID=UPI000467B59A|nr:MULTISPECIES: DUF445 family protein [unclassified Lebetimonas]